jgi:hypothetical protein
MSWGLLVGLESNEVIMESSPLAWPSSLHIPKKTAVKGDVLIMSKREVPGVAQVNVFGG